jgi:RNA polymerase sigma factor (sigma-70 family)
MSDSAWADDYVVTAARTGDVEAIETLVSASHPHVHRFALSLCSTPQDAEDAAQEALLILYRKIGTLRASAALTSWMYRIVRNECLRRARQLLHHRPTALEVGTASVEDDVVRRLEADLLVRTIAALPADQRAVLIMRDVQNCPGRMVAEAMGLSTPAMKSRLHRARAAVREALRGPDSPDGEHDD